MLDHRCLILSWSIRKIKKCDSKKIYETPASQEFRIKEKDNFGGTIIQDAKGSSRSNGYVH